MQGLESILFKSTETTLAAMEQDVFPILLVTDRSLIRQMKDAIRGMSIGCGLKFRKIGVRWGKKEEGGSG